MRFNSLKMHISDVNTDDDDEPQPKKNLRPVKKIPNAADRFRQHEEEFVSRGKLTNDRIERVLQHNAAYPKLIDELDKKRSTGKVEFLSDNQKPSKKENCGTSLNLYSTTRCTKTRHQSSQKKKVSEKKKSNSNRRARKRCHSAGKYYGAKKVKQDSSCQYQKRRWVQKENKHSHFRKRTAQSRTSQKTDSTRDDQIDDPNNDRSDYRIPSQQNSFKTSGTSFKSYPSTDHEPLV